ncbi:hypothetical protein [Gottfriedia acidiceleris]|uniref:hypothetical protein n=1 Tax=Gottfriedia acidiceleris TaxID=371036 RepID=UPI002FFE6601
MPLNIVLNSWIALDYWKTKEDPPIIYIDVDEDQIINIAPNFEVLLTCLTNW